MTGAARPVRVRRLLRVALGPTATLCGSPARRGSADREREGPASFVRIHVIVLCPQEGVEILLCVCVQARLYNEIALGQVPTIECTYIKGLWVRQIELNARGIQVAIETARIFRPSDFSKGGEGIPSSPFYFIKWQPA